MKEPHADPDQHQIEQSDVVNDVDNCGETWENLSKVREEFTFDRRSVLKFGGAVGTGFISTSIAGGKVVASDNEKKFKRIVEEANNILKEGGGREDREDFLKNEGLYIAKNTGEYTYSDLDDTSKDKEPTDDVTPDSTAIDKEELDIEIELVTDGFGTYYSSLTWEYDKELDGFAQLPSDRVGIGFDVNWWEYRWNSISTTTSTSHGIIEPNEEEWGPDDPSNISGGAVFTVETTPQNIDVDDTYSAGVYLDPIGNYPEEQRRVQGSYNANNGVGSIDSVSIGFGPISVSSSIGVHSWTTITENDQDTLLRLSQEDAEYQPV